MITDIFQNCLILQRGIEMFEGVTKEFGPDLGGKKARKKAIETLKKTLLDPNLPSTNSKKNVITLTYK